MISKKAADRTGMHIDVKNTNKEKVLLSGEASVQKITITMISREIILRMIKRVSKL